jgi:cell division protein FtsW (lipid II flippase)
VARLTRLAVPRRRTELGLMILAVALTASAYTLVSLGKTATVPTNIRPFVGVIAALLISAHIATRRLARFADATILSIAAVLNGLGYVFIVRLKPGLANKQAAWTAVGIAAYIATLFIVREAKRLQYARYTFFFVGIGLLLAPLVPGIGYARNGSRIWVRLGPVTFQPGEIAKLTLALFFAAYLVEKRELLAISGRKILGVQLPEFRHMGPILVAWGFSIAVMVSEKDLGSSLLFFTLFVVMLWVATGRTAFISLGTLMFGAGATGAYFMFGHVQDRVSTWLNPWAAPTVSAAGKLLDPGYQLRQGLFAMGSGGIGGTGFGQGRPTRIPASYNDFIIAAIGEELGLFGTTAVLLCFLLMVGAGLRIALRSDVAFDKLLAVGLTTIIGVQTFIIVGGVTRIVPLTGVTLPFVSYGGSSLVINYVMIALLARISHDANARLGESAPLTIRQKRTARKDVKIQARIPKPIDGSEDETTMLVRETGGTTP